jgi:hypothetical protein
LLLLSCAIAGCSLINEYEDPTIVGRWRADQHELTLDLNGSGKGSLHFGLEPAAFVDTYRIEWEHDDIDVFLLELSCRSSTGPGPCNDHDLECDVDGDTMRCKASTIPNLRDLRWRRR